MSRFVQFCVEIGIVRSEVTFIDSSGAAGRLRLEDVSLEIVRKLTGDRCAGEVME